MKLNIVAGLLLPVLSGASLPVLDIRHVAQVYTTSGLIIGHPSVNKTDVTEYLGVPYAASTAGSRRFLPPQRFTSSKKFIASTYVGCTSVLPNGVFTNFMHKLGPVRFFLVAWKLRML